MDLHPGERVIFHGHPSWRSILAFHAAALVLALVAGAIAAGVTRASEDSVDWPLAIGVFLACLAIGLLVGFLKRITTVYAITTQRLRIKRGLIARNVQQTRIERVQNVTTDQSLVERLLRIGSVDFDTAGTDDSDFSFRGVERPSRVAEAVDQAQREASGSGAGV